MGDKKELEGLVTWKWYDGEDDDSWEDLEDMPDWFNAKHKVAIDRERKNLNEKKKKK